MRWDDRIFEGVQGHWHWIVFGLNFDLRRTILREHLGFRLWIVAFDGGPVAPSDEEIAAGWKLIGDAMVSPPISADLDVPTEESDEWYLFEETSICTQSFTKFVNYGGFNLADPRKLTESFDPTWERDALDWLYPIQEQFWLQMDSLCPISYVAISDRAIVVSRQPGFISTVRERVVSA